MRYDISLGRLRWTGIPCSLLGVGAALPPDSAYALHRKTLQCRHLYRRCGAAILLVWGVVWIHACVSLKFCLGIPPRKLRSAESSTPGRPHEICSRRRILLPLGVCMCCLVSCIREARGRVSSLRHQACRRAVFRKSVVGYFAGSAPEGSLTFRIPPVTAWSKKNQVVA